MKTILCSLLFALFATMTFAQEANVSNPDPVKVTPSTSQPKELSETLKLKIQLSATKRQLLMTQFEEMKAKFDAAIKKMDEDFQKTSSELSTLVDQAYVEAKVTKGDFDLDVVEAKFISKPPATPAANTPTEVK